MEDDNLVETFGGHEVPASMVKRIREALGEIFIAYDDLPDHAVKVAVDLSAQVITELKKEYSL